VGNWYINIESPDAALEHHDRALQIAEELNDAPLLAETYDYLGMDMIIVGDTRRSADYYSRAIKLFHATDNQFGLVSSQSAFGFLHRNYDTDLVIVHQPYQDAIRQMEEALASAHEMGWSTQESFTTARLATTYASQGSYTHALELAHTALVKAETIQHHQWIVNALYAIGVIHADLLDAEYARPQFERALELAQNTQSVYWRRLIRAWLVVALTGEGNRSAAHAQLNLELTPDTPMRTLSQRRLWSARILLALSERDAAVALDLTEKLIASAVDISSGMVMPLLWYVRARALNQLGQYKDAETSAREGIERAHVENVRPLIWRLYASHSGALRGQGRSAEADAALETALACAGELASNIPTEITDNNGQLRALREIFLTRVRRRIESMSMKA
jgi:tetratricopeptide (TPR) repeat protein